MKQKIKLLYIDLFCGAGGTSTGVENARLNGEKCAKVIPCWSLAALLAIYPMALVMDFSGKYAASCISSPMSVADNPIDAVYEIIIWLNENKHLKNNKP